MKSAQLIENLETLVQFLRDPNVNGLEDIFLINLEGTRTEGSYEDGYFVVKFEKENLDLSVRRSVALSNWLDGDWTIVKVDPYGFKLEVPCGQSG